MRDWDLVPFPEPSPEVLDAICERHGLPRVARRVASNGAINSIWLLGEELVLRIPKDMDEGWKDTLTESVAVPAACATGMRTPALVVFDETLDLVSVPFTVYERVEGEAGGPSSPAGWRHLGREIALLHGSVTSCPDPLDRLDSWERWTEPDDVLAHAAQHGLDGALRARLDADLASLQPAVASAAGFSRFLHGDLHNGNLMAVAGEHEAVIDWGDAAWGDPVGEVPSLPEGAVADFLAGYREVMPIDGDESVDERIRWDRICRAVAAEDGPDAAALGRIRTPSS